MKEEHNFENKSNENSSFCFVKKDNNLLQTHNLLFEYHKGRSAHMNGLLMLKQSLHL